MELSMMQFDFSEEAVRRRLEELTRDNEVQAMMKLDNDHVLPQVALRRRLEDFTLDSEVQLLLDGVPEIQFGDDTVSDDLVDHLLQLGGKPPSQLQLPTAQINQHEVLKTLQDVTMLNISLKNLSIFSARYGVRKVGTFITIKTPNYYEISLGKNPYHVDPNPDYGDHLPMNDSKKPKGTPFIRRSGEEARFALKELQALEDPQPTIRRNDKKDSIKKFFLGDCDLHHSLTVNISITDRLLQDWMRNDNLIEIAMFGFVAPPGTQLRGISLSPSCFARAKINPISLLTCPELDAMVNLDLIADKPTLSDVTQRMQLLLAGTKMKPLSDRMGVLSVRLTLLPKHDNNRDKKDEIDLLDVHSSSSREEKRSYNEPVRLIPSEISLPKRLPNIPQFVPPEDSALLYTPHQSPETEETTHFLTTTPAEMLRTALNRQPKPLPPKEIFLGIAVFAMTGAVVTDSLRNVLRGQRQPHPDDCICLRFKISKDRTDVLRIPLTHCQPDHTQPDALMMPLGKLVTMKDRLSHPPFLEIWVELKTVENPYAIDNEAQENLIHRHLLAWSSRKNPVLFHQVTKLQLLDPTTMQACGKLYTVFYQHEYPYFIEEKLQQQLDSFKLPQPFESSGIKKTDLIQSVVSPRNAAPMKHIQSLDDVNEVDNNMNNESNVKDSIEPNLVEKIEVSELIDATHRPRSDSLVSDDSLGDSSGDKSHLFTSINSSQPAKDISPEKVQAISSHHNGVYVPSQFSETVVLDIAPHGISSVFASNVPSSATPTSSMTMGCFVCYALPGIDTGSTPADIRVTNTEGTRVVHFPKDSVMRADQYMFSLWWDADCAILNGRNRHIFTLPTQPAVTVYELARALGVDAHIGLEFYIVGSDLDGNLLRDNSYLSCGSISLETLVDCFNNTNLHEDILTIPLTANSLSQFNVNMLPMIPVELQLRLSWRREPFRLSWQRLSKQSLVTDFENTTNHRTETNVKEKAIPIIRKEELQPLPLEKAIPYSFQEEFCLPTYSVTVLALHHLKMKPLDIQSHPHHHCELIYSLQHAGDIMAANVPANIHKILDKIAYPENFRVTSTAFPGQPNARIEVGQHHRVQTPIRKSTLLQDISSPELSLVDNSLTERNALFCATFSGLGVLTLSLYERHSLFPSDSYTTVASKDVMGPTGIIQATDVLLGVAAVDLDVMLRGLAVLDGWYNLVDSVQTVVGQVLLRVEPLQIDCLQNRYQTHEVFPTKLLVPTDASDMFAWKQKSYSSEANNNHNNDDNNDNNVSGIFTTDKNYESSATRILYGYEKTDKENEDEQILLDITGMENDALEIMLADLEATKERLLTTFGLKPTLIEKNSETLTGNSINKKLSPAPSASETEYSSDFESLSSSPSEEKRSTMIREEKTAIHISQHATVNFTAELDAAASPVKLPFYGTTSYAISDTLDASSSLESKSLQEEGKEWGQEYEEEHEINIDIVDKETHDDEEKNGREKFVEYNDLDDSCEKEFSNDHGNDHDYPYDDEDQQQVSETEDIEVLRTAPTPPSSTSFINDTSFPQIETIVSHENETKFSEWVDNSAIFPFSKEAPSTAIPTDNIVETVCSVYSPDKDDIINHTQTEVAENNSSSMQLDSILDLLQYHHPDGDAGHPFETLGNDASHVKDSEAEVDETIEFSQSNLMDSIAQVNAQESFPLPPKQDFSLDADIPNYRDNVDSVIHANDEPFSHESAVNVTNQPFESTSFSDNGHPEPLHILTPAEQMSNNKSFSAEEVTIHISYSCQLQSQSQSAPERYSPVESQSVAIQNAAEIEDVTSTFPHLLPPSVPVTLGSHPIAPHYPLRDIHSQSVSTDTATSPIRVIVPFPSPVSSTSLSTTISAPATRSIAKDYKIERLIVGPETLPSTARTGLAAVRSTMKSAPSEPQSASGVNLESLLPAQVLRRIIPAPSSSKDNKIDASHAAHSIVKDIATQHKHRRKMDEETERIARIMRGKLSSSSS